MPFPPRYRLALVSAAFLAACSRGDAGTVTTAHAQGERARDSLRAPADVRLPEIADPAGAYVVEAVTNGGTVAGMVQIDGVAPSDTSIVPPEEIRRECGQSFVDATVVTKGAGLGGAVVWLEGVRRGKAPPSVRRHEVSLAKCRLVPRAQAVFAGGTLHVHGEDRLKSLVRVARWPGGEVAATIAMNDAGEVVPDDRVLARAGTLELKGAMPAWLRAWVLVFDHPYAATTSDVGAFSLDSVPPGQYTLVAWHERFGRVAQPVTVQPGVATSVTLRFPASGVPNAAAPAPAPALSPDTARR